MKLWKYKILRNLCLHYARQDEQDRNNGKKITQLKWPKHQKKKIWDEQNVNFLATGDVNYLKRNVDDWRLAVKLFVTRALVRAGIDTQLYEWKNWIILSNVTMAIPNMMKIMRNFLPNAFIGM